MTKVKDIQEWNVDQLAYELADGHLGDYVGEFGRSHDGQEIFTLIRFEVDND